MTHVYYGSTFRTSVWCAVRAVWVARREAQLTQHAIYVDKVLKPHFYFYPLMAVLVMLVLAVVLCALLSNVMSCMLKPVQQPSWFRNNIFVVKRKARFPLLVIHENASVDASNDWLERLCHAGSNSSDTGRDILIEDAVKCILHLLFKAIKSIVDSPKAAAFHSFLKMKWAQCWKPFFI